MDINLFPEFLWKNLGNTAWFMVLG